MGDGQETAWDGRGGRGPWRAVRPALLMLAGVCVVGAAIGFFRTGRTYRSTALVALAGPPGTPAGAPVGNPAVWAAEAKLAASRRVVDLAMAGPDWAGGWPRGPAASVASAKGLSTEVQPGGVIRIAYDDPDPAAAQGRLAAFVNAYRVVVREDESGLSARRVALLSQLLKEERDEQRQQAIAARIAGLSAVPATEPTRVVAPAGPARLVPARHWRDAGWGAAVAGALVVMVRGPHVWRAWRTARVIAAGRTAFPVVVAPVTPKPVVSIGDDEEGGGVGER